MSSWKLAVGLLQIREWQPNFNPYKELSSTAQVWVRLFHLPAEYWHPEFLVGIFRAVGNVIKLDGNTAYGLVGHFARALVEIDLNQPIIDTIRVGLQDNLLSVDFSYENIPTLCSFCNFVGHLAENCRKAKAKASKEDKQNQNQQAAPKQRWVEKPKSAQPMSTDLCKQQADVTTPNPFDALPDSEDFVPETIHADTQEHNKAVEDESHTDERMSTDDDKDFVDETQFQSPAAIMDMVTVSVDDTMMRPAEISEDAKRRLIAKVKQTARKRQLRTELKAKSGFAGGGTSSQAPGKADPQQQARIPESHEEAAVVSATPSSPLSKDNPSLTTPTDGAAATAEMPDVAATANEAAASVAAEEITDDTATAQHKSQLEDTATKEGLAKRSKPKRKAKEIPQTTRQLRSSTKPDALQALADKRTQVAPNSSHSKRDQVDDKLRAAVELGMHPTAYVIDTGQSGALRAMDLIANQQWDDLAHTEAFADSEDFSD